MIRIIILGSILGPPIHGNPHQRCESFRIRGVRRDAEMANPPQLSLKKPICEFSVIWALLFWAPYMRDPIILGLYLDCRSISSNWLGAILYVRFRSRYPCPRTGTTTQFLRSPSHLAISVIKVSAITAYIPLQYLN